MGRNNKFNMYDKGDMPLGSDSDLRVSKVSDRVDSGKTNGRVRKAAYSEADLERTLGYSSRGGRTSRVARNEPREYVSYDDDFYDRRGRYRSSSLEYDDLDDINSGNIRKHSAKAKRNNVAISVLIGLLIAAIAIISIYAVYLKMRNNCRLYIHGASASYLVNGKNVNAFRAPQALKGNTVFVFDLDLQIKDTREYNIRFRVDAYESGKKMTNIILYDYDQDDFTLREDGYYYSDYKMSGTVDLFGGIVLDISHKDTLTNANFKLAVHTYLY